MKNFSEKISFLWSIAELLRDSFKRSKYQDVILPLTVLRRIDCVLQPTKAKVLERQARLKAQGLQNLDTQLRKASGYAFYNTSLYDFEKLLNDAPNLAANLRNYIAGFSPNMREVLEKFDFDNTLTKLDEAGLLFLVLERFNAIDLHPNVVSNLEMGYIFEELIRKFNEALNENPGEHFTPREVIRLMVNLLLAQDREALSHNHVIRTVADPCCGSGGMLTIAKERILEMNPNAQAHLFGQEVNPETFAVCKADLYMKSPDGTDADNIKFGSVLSNDQHATRHFDYMLANPPYGKEWKMDADAVNKEAEKGDLGRFGAGLPRISDGQLLFLQHMLKRIHAPAQNGGRVAIVMNGSPLFTGDAGSGESEIRRWILQNDWLEAIVALPEQLFYNTGIATYVWILSNRKADARRGKAQLINATTFWTPMRKSLGDKRREISDAQIEEITKLFTACAENEHSKIFETTAFGYRKITVERPLRLNFQASAERIERLRGERAFQNLATSKKKEKRAAQQEIEAGRAFQEKILALVRSLPNTLYKNRAAFEAQLDTALGAATERLDTVKISAPVRKALLNALSERDATADICFDQDGKPEADAELRDYENVPLGQDVHDFFAREVLPHVPDAWLNSEVRDALDGEIGKVGYEINFNRYFYQYQPPRPLEEIEADIKLLEKEILEMLRA